MSGFLTVAQAADALTEALGREITRKRVRGAVEAGLLHAYRDPDGRAEPRISPVELARFIAAQRSGPTLADIAAATFKSNVTTPVRTEP